MLPVVTRKTAAVLKTLESRWKGWVQSSSELSGTPIVSRESEGLAPIMYVAHAVVWVRLWPCGHCTGSIPHEDNIKCKMVTSRSIWVTTCRTHCGYEKE